MAESTRVRATWTPPGWRQGIEGVIVREYENGRLKEWLEFQPDPKSRLVRRTRYVRSCEVRVHVSLGYEVEA